MMSSQVETWCNKCTRNPEAFSPNVALRPIYQQSILPNISFIGGPSEVAYWLQLAPAFTMLNVHYPQVLLRDQCITVNQSTIDLQEQLCSFLGIPSSWRSRMAGCLS